MALAAYVVLDGAIFPDDVGAGAGRCISTGAGCSDVAIAAVAEAIVSGARPCGARRAASPADNHHTAHHGACAAGGRGPFTE